MTCKHENTDSTLEGYNVCIDCGVVLSLNNMSDNEWFDNIGPEQTTNDYPFQGISTFIKQGSRSLITKNGKIKQNDILTLHIQNSFSYKQKSFAVVRDYIENIDIPTIVKNDIKNSWIKFINTRKIIKSDNRFGLLIYIIFINLKKYNNNMTPLEICKLFGFKNTRLFLKGKRVYKNLDEVVTGEDFQIEDIDTFYENLNGYVLRYLSQLETSGIITNYYSFYNKFRTVYTMNESQYENLSKFKPGNVAIAIIYELLNNVENDSSTNNVKCSSTNDSRSGLNNVKCSSTNGVRLNNVKCSKQKLCKLLGSSIPTITKIKCFLNLE